MSLYKRGDRWWIYFSTASGKRIRQSAGTQNRTEAKEYHDRLKAEVWRSEKLGEKRKRSWDEAALRFLREAEGKATLKDYKRHIAFWTEHFRGRQLDTIGRLEVADLIEAYAGTPATRNRYIASVRAVLMKAAVWEWLERAPKLKTYREPRHRVRWLEKDEAERLMTALPAWVAAIARFALATGLRQSNVLKLEWTQVNLVKRVAWIHPDQAKARRAIGVPLNRDATQVLLLQRGKHLRRVFVGPDGMPMENWSHRARSAWEAACRKVGIERFRFHDLRHTWASWHVQQGTPLYALKELGGWETLEMVKRYAHLAPEHLLGYAENIGSGATPQIRHSDVKELQQEAR